MNPHTIQEWQQYIESLTGADLWSKAVAANSQAFADRLLEEGFKMSDVQLILTFFAYRLKALEQKIPTEGAFDLVALSRVPLYTPSNIV